MATPQVESLVSQILQALPGSADLDAAVDKVKTNLAKMLPGLETQLAPELEHARELVLQQINEIEILRTHSVISRRPQWYFGPRLTDLYWPALRDYFTDAKDWHPDDVSGIDEASNEIVSLLENPTQTQFSCRGLVLGHVQSGKTANMTAVIAKALDAGYNTVIVLAGLTNKLRFQTQHRFISDLVQRHPTSWQVLTPTTLDEDFRAPPHGGFLAHVDKAQLAVIKKVVSPLEQLRTAIERTHPATLARLRILVIDDECDQASVNAARDEFDITAINRRIRELLSMLPAVTYVGYTATPFANVLINPYSVEGQDLDDLYPRDFITALSRPKSYFGTEQLFGRPPVDPEDMQPEEEGLDMIRIVPDEERKLLQPANRRDRESFHPKLAKSFETAIIYFLACCAARRAREDSDQHMTMLVHTSAYVADHVSLAELVKNWRDEQRDKINTSEFEDLSQRIRTVWEEEQCRLPSNITEAPLVGIDEILEHLPAVLQTVDVAIENGSSKDRIDYTGSPRTYIVVGGSILARGLTLEGLMVSFFLRSANQYDTLLQMGRWFGYRRRYEDLPRIWMTVDLKLRFRAMAAIESEIRDEIEQYRYCEQTPMEIAVRIRTIPGMAITSANRMRTARQSAISYWGIHRQTFRFEHQNQPLLQQNWNSAAELVSRAEELGYRDREWPTKLWRGVPKSSIIRFFETYNTHPTHADLARNFLVDFLKGADGRLSEWNIGIVEPQGSRVSRRPLGAVGNVHVVSRARLNDTGDVADIKALMSKDDIRFDCPDDMESASKWNDLKSARLRSIGQVPLLLLYAIKCDSVPRTVSNIRVPLNAIEDVLAFGVVFPGSVTEGGNYVSVELEPLSADEIDELTAEEAAQMEAAGVT